MFRIDKIQLAVGAAKHFDEKQPKRGDPASDCFNGELAII
jgi:hypothetical protein